MDILPRIRIDVHLSEGDKLKVWINCKNEEIRTPLRGKEIIGHSNGVRLIGKDVIYNQIVGNIKQRMKHWDIIGKRQICNFEQTAGI